MRLARSTANRNQQGGEESADGSQATMDARPSVQSKEAQPELVSPDETSRGRSAESEQFNQDASNPVAIKGAALETMNKLEEELRRLPVHVVRESNGWLNVNLRATVPFSRDSAEIPETSTAMLDRLAIALAAYRNIALEVIGHTDKTGAEIYNVQLSKRRAAAVANYLKDRDAATSIKATGVGSKHPVTGNARASRELNRRTVLRIYTISDS